MNNKLILPLVISCIGSIGVANGADIVRGYDFAYQVRGERDAMPSQVFSGNGKTYFQLRNPELIPSIVAQRQGVSRQIIGTLEKPYYIVNDVSPSYLISMANKSASVTYQGADVDIQTAVFKPDVAPAKVENPVPPTLIDKTSSIPKSETKKVSENDSKSESVLVAKDSKSTQDKCEWVIDPKYQTIRNNLESWSQRAGYQLFYELKVDFPIEVTGRFCGSFENAVEQVLISFGSTETPMHGILYEGNNVLRIVNGAK